MLRKKAKTIDKPKFTDAKDTQINDALNLVFNAMKEKGYNPYNQLTYYLLSEDPIHVTNHNNARKTITELDRDEIFRHILKYYFES